MQILSLEKALSRYDYPGRGIVTGLSSDSKYALTIYFIMGRSENSRNRVFIADGKGIRTQAFDPSKMTDPSLIIYSPVRVLGQNTIVTNGDQTDTVYDGLKQDLTFQQSLNSRTFEPDAPNFTPRISSLLQVSDGTFSFKMSILKSMDKEGKSCGRYCFDYDKPIAGQARFIHTYMGDGNPLPSFEGEPELLDLSGIATVEKAADLAWKSLNQDNKVSLFARFIELSSGKTFDKIINKNA